MNNLNLFIEIIANRDAEKTNPILRKFKYPTFYKFYENIKTASDARNTALKRTINSKYSSFSLFAGHDYDDTYIDEFSLAKVLQPMIDNEKLSLCFGNAVFKYQDKSLKKLYKNYKGIDVFFKINKKENIYDTIINYISKYTFFPSQAAVYKRTIAFDIGGFPDCKSLEDRIFTIKYLIYTKKQKLGVKFINIPIVYYIQHDGSESVENHKNGIRKKLMNNIKKWFKLYSKNPKDTPELYDYIC